MLEVECPAVTPEPVLRASGHVERFTDLMVTDVGTGDCHRADHLLEAALEALLEASGKEAPTREAAAAARDLLARVGELKAPELGAALTQYGVKAPGTGADISAPFPFNLMFKTSIGPRGDMVCGCPSVVFARCASIEFNLFYFISIQFNSIYAPPSRSQPPPPQVGYLRPETAQGIFVNFRDLLYYNGGKLPFAAAQIGSSYRNEIAPRQGLLRVREFTQAEIEHFCHPQDKSHPKFASVATVAPLLYARAAQMGAAKRPTATPLGAAVADGTIANETLAYFIGRTFLFCRRIGLDPAKVRFRQHLAHEMAHYAEDCWDCEVECSHGWVECAGLADRSAYDLTAHARASGVELAAYERYAEPREEETLVVIPDKQALGKAYKREAGKVAEALLALGAPAALALGAELDAGRAGTVRVGDADMEVAPGMAAIRMETRKVAGRAYTPAVIEPSFGIGRLLYCMFEHCYYVREGDEKRSVFRFTPLAAPIKATVFPLMGGKPELVAAAAVVAAELTRAGLSTQVDTTGATIGKRYARTDELGVPFAVTIDYATLADATVTLRERDSMAQVRVPRAELPGVLRRLVDMDAEWSDVAEQYPLYCSASAEDGA